MRDRCFNLNATGFKHYGGRGISVCPEWDSFAQFIEDMGERPEGASLDRINNDGNYCPENCKWSTRVEQNLNKRYLGRKDEVTAVIDGEKIDTYEAARRLGCNHTAIRHRLKAGWSVEDAFTRLPRPDRRRPQP